MAFEGMETKDGDTILTGRIIEQPHLHGIHDPTNGLGLQLLGVQAVPDDAHQNAGVKRQLMESKS